MQRIQNLQSRKNCKESNKRKESIEFDRLQGLQKNQKSKEREKKQILLKTQGLQR